jgi:hypothetical protein
MAELVRVEKDELARLDAISMGRPVNTFFDSHYAATHFDYFAEAAYGQGHTSLNTPGFLNMSLRQPYGVVAIIIPWYSSARKLLQPSRREIQSCSKAAKKLRLRHGKSARGSKSAVSHRA